MILGGPSGPGRLLRYGQVMEREQTFLVYLPKPGARSSALFTAGSALVAEAGKAGDCTQVDYEAPSLASNVKTFADRVDHASDRQRTAYATHKRLLVPISDLIELGSWDAREGLVRLNDAEAEGKLASWLRTSTLELAELEATSHHYEIQRVLARMVSSHDPADRLHARFVAKAMGAELP